MEKEITGRVVSVNGPIVKAAGMVGIGMLDIAEVGPHNLVGEVIRLKEGVATIQVYEDNTGLKPGDSVRSSGRPLSALLGPGMIGNIYDGIQRPLMDIEKISGDYIKKGIKVSPLNDTKKWHFVPLKTSGDSVEEGTILGEVQETEAITHRIIVPPGIKGSISFMVPEGEYTILDDIYTVTGNKDPYNGKLAEYWPVRKQRPFARKRKAGQPLITGQRIIDSLFPLSMGGTAAIPGGFGTGKTMTQHALAKWCNADIIVYIGCGERGNEMTDVLNEFPELIDPRSERPLMERTIMIANTSNMPVAAREVSIYTGVTIAEYYRDMGYNVAVMADSTSRWAEALRELSSRLGDMPAEEGFPSYLATRLAEFYERAGFVETMSKKDGSISIIGAVSPPGGDFSEPVTQHTTRFVRCFWALNKVLADARHYPSISWIDSYTEYIDEISEWWTELEADWLTVRKEAINILLEEERLQQIVKLIGPDALPIQDRFVLFCAELIKNGFLQQNSFDPKDMYCSPEKQAKLLDILIHFYKEGTKVLAEGQTISSILFMDTVPEISRLKSEIGNDELDKLDTFKKRLEAELYTLKGMDEDEKRTGI
ncbi:MAG: V-type ATP synthase subunit A [bacterium]|nr:V-type ATP synthase subunit A [bacterium]